MLIETGRTALHQILAEKVVDNPPVSVTVDWSGQDWSRQGDDFTWKGHQHLSAIVSCHRSAVFYRFRLATQMIKLLTSAQTSWTMQSFPWY